MEALVDNRYTPPSSIERLHRRRRIAIARSDACRERVVDPLQVYGRKRDRERAVVLRHVARTLRARDRHDVVAPRQHPGERELSRGRALRRGDEEIVATRSRFFWKLAPMKRGELWR